MELRLASPATRGLVALAAVLPALLDQGSVDGSRTAWTLLAWWAGGSVVALLLPPRYVVATALLAFLAVGSVELVASAQQAELSFLDLAPSAVALAGLGARAGRREVVAVSAFVVAVVVAGVVVNRLTADPEWQGGVDVLAGVLVLAAGLLAGLFVSALQRERRAAEHEATLAERERLAREMHDVVAHSVTLLVLGAETLRARRAELPAWVGEQADAMAGSGRRAADEMRALLSVLADGDPAPGEIAGLVAEARRHGLDVRLVETGPAGGLTAAAARTAYDVVREALTNHRRYAAGSPATVTLAWERTGLTVTVATVPDPTAPATAGSGRGLAGLRVRLAGIGGSLDVAHDPSAHRLTAVVPR